MRVMSDFREALWGVLQQAISTLDVDFVSYANHHLSRLLANAAEPAFAEAMRAVAPLIAKSRPEAEGRPLALTRHGPGASTACATLVRLRATLAIARAPHHAVGTVVAFRGWFLGAPVTDSPYRAGLRTTAPSRMTGANEAVVVDSPEAPPADGKREPRLLRPFQSADGRSEAARPPRLDQARGGQQGLPQREDGPQRRGPGRSRRGISCSWWGRRAPARAR